MVSPENSGLPRRSYFAEFVCCEDLDSNSCFVLERYFRLPQLFVFLFDVLSVAVFAIRDRSVLYIWVILLKTGQNCDIEGQNSKCEFFNAIIWK